MLHTRNSLMQERNFCYMPWHGLAVAANGNIKPCCQWADNLGKVEKVDLVDAFKKHTKIIQLRQDFLDGKKPESCKSCWTREEQIGESRRKWFAEKFMSTIPADYSYNVELDDIRWTQMDINLSNVCNLKCRMCGSWASNSWFEEDIALSKISPAFQKENNPANQNIRQHSLEDLSTLLPYLSNILRIDFKGGEPMMAKNHVPFLEMLIEKGLNDKIVLQYTTNGTVVNPKILNVLSKFKKVRLMFSIEGTGSLYEYIRGGKYSIQELEEVIEMYDALPNIEIGFNVTIQAYNLLNLHHLHNKLASWANKFKNVSNNSAFTTICNSPMYLSPFVLPEAMRRQAIVNLKGYSNFEVLSRNLTSDNIHKKHWNTFKHFTIELDKLREECILDVVPELKDYWNE
jgi:radical SAM protein with 4Fe4S-binding SPASM domain